MNTPSIFISIPYSRMSNDAGMFQEKEIGLNIIIDSIEMESDVIIKFARRFHFNYIFSFSGLILRDGDISKILPFLYTLFTLSGNFRKNNNCIPVFSVSKDEQLPALEIVKEYFRLQGDETIQFAMFEPGNEAGTKENVLVSSTTQFKKIDEELSEKYNDLKPNQVILIAQNTGRLEEEIFSLKSLVANNKYAKRLLNQVSSRTEAAWQVHKLGLWKARASLYFSFISLSKRVGENQYYDIIEWYKNEYEVLPLWYKRFGHILKVFKGKRTIKSLFERNK